MSYILDALRKSDQQRQYGVAPTLSSAQIQSPAASSPGKQRRFTLSLIAVALLGVGVVIGVLRPWQPTTAQIPAPLLSPRAQSATTPAPPPPLKPEPAAALLPEAPPVAKPSVTRAAPTTTPPLASSLPNITITVHAYAPEPTERLAGINGRLVHEGDEVAPGLKLERITVDGVILNFKGQRFRRGV